MQRFRLVAFLGPLLAVTQYCGAELPSRTLKGHQGSILSVAYSPDGATLASVSSDRTARLWDAHTGQLKRILQGHTGGLERGVFSPNGEVLATSSQDATIRLWDVATGSVKHVLKGHESEIDSV